MTTVFIISAPSGSGKSTLVHRLLKTVPNLAFSISYTTRRPRPSETDGVDYIFISRKDFEDRLARGKVNTSILDWIAHVLWAGLERLEVEEGYRHAAFHDELTDLPNRRGIPRVCNDFRFSYPMYLCACNPHISKLE